MDASATLSAITPTEPFRYERKVAEKRDWGASLPQADKDKIHKTAKSFESMFVSEMMNYMFTDTDMSDSMFGGGTGEDMYKSLLVNQYSEKMASSGQAFIAPTLEREMLRMQEIQRNPRLAHDPYATVKSSEPETVLSQTSEVSHEPRIQPAQ